MDVKNVIVVLSGKGGVGKSTVATQLALQIKSKGHKVGILDVDICGPSVPFLLNLEGSEIHSSSTGAWVPVFADGDSNLAVMSIGFITPDRNSAIVWRGPKKTGMIRQFIKDVAWEGIEYLIIDTPPGTSDEHITLVEELRSHPNYGAVIVTTPQHVAVEDVRRQVTFCKKTGLAILGVIENLSGFVCPSCQDCSYIFSSGGGQALADLAQVPLLGRLPIDPNLSDIGNGRKSLIEYLPNSPASSALNEVVNNVLSAVNKPKSS